MSRELNKIMKILKIFCDVRTVGLHVEKYFHDFSEFIYAPARQRLVNGAALSRAAASLPEMVT
jgi:hypothetical protein